jgi:uncharacterized protein (UPF0335 family)
MSALGWNDAISRSEIIERLQREVQQLRSEVERLQQESTPPKADARVIPRILQLPDQEKERQKLREAIGASIQLRLDRQTMLGWRL